MEFERWLTPERIVQSDFMEVIWDGLKDGSWDQEEAANLSTLALRGFGNGSCYFLASAVASVTGQPIVGFWRMTGDDRLVHAVVQDPTNGYAADILGSRPLTSIRSELTEAVGELRLSVLPPIGEEMDRFELDCLLDIAAGLPWMRVGRDAPDKRCWSSLVMSYVEARQAA